MQKTFINDKPEVLDKEVNEFCKDKIVLHKVTRTEALGTASKSVLYIFEQIEYKERPTIPEVKA